MNKLTEAERIDYFWQHVVKGDGCWLWTGRPDPKGYGRCKALGFLGVGNLAHRIAYRLAIGPIPDDLDVLHSCDNPPCNRPDHLHPGLHKDNMAEMTARGRAATGDRNAQHARPEIRARGERSGGARLIDEQVTNIRRLYATGGYSCEGLAVLFDVSDSTTSAILIGRTWAHLHDNLQPTIDRIRSESLCRLGKQARRHPLAGPRWSEQAS